MTKKYLIFTLLVFSLSCTSREQQPFSFVQLCDPQLGMGGYEHDLQTFQQAVDQINTMNPDFVVICGDLVGKPTDSSFSDFNKIKEGFKMPCYCAPGNHDIGGKPNDTTLNYYRKKIGPDYYEFQNKGYSFIVTNTQFWKVDVRDESEKHDKWFKEILMDRSRENIPVFVVGHIPLYIESPREEEKYFNFPLSKRKEMLELFSRNDVVAYLTGHTHKTVINNYENIQLVSGENTSKSFDKKPFGFRVWEVSSDTLMHRFVALQNADLFQENTENN